MPDPFVLAGTEQRRRLEYQLVVKVRSLRDHTGAYTVLDRIRTALSGQALRGMRFYPSREQFEDVSNGVWTYLAVYAADVPWVSQAQFPDDVAAALAAAKLTVMLLTKVLVWLGRISAIVAPLLGKALLTAFLAAAKGAWALAVALAANPITWIIAGIIALGVAIYLLVKHWDVVKVATQQFWSWFTACWNAGMSGTRVFNR